MSDNEDKNKGFITVCCIGIIIVALIIAGASMFFNNDNPDNSVSLVLGG